MWYVVYKEWTAQAAILHAVCLVENHSEAVLRFFPPPSPGEGPLTATSATLGGGQIGRSRIWRCVWVLSGTL